MSKRAERPAATPQPRRQARPPAARAAAARAGSAAVFAALGDETRLQLVRRLCGGGPQSIAGLSHGAGVTRQAVTKHLEVLSRAGLVRGSRRGRERVWELEPARLGEAREWLDAIGRQWDAALERLRVFVEEKDA
jgi:DNA-binding transcriptional ArsR family regulator